MHHLHHQTLDSRHAHLLTDPKDRAVVAHNGVSCDKLFKVVG